VKQHLRTKYVYTEALGFGQFGLVLKVWHVSEKRKRVVLCVDPPEYSLQ